MSQPHRNVHQAAAITVATAAGTVDLQSYLDSLSALASGTDVGYAESNVVSSTNLTGGNWFDVPGMSMVVTPRDRPVWVTSKLAILEAQFDGMTQTRLLNVTDGIAVQAAPVAFSAAVRRPASPGLLAYRLLAGSGPKQFKVQVTLESGAGTVRINSNPAGTAAVGINWMRATES